MVSGGAWVLAWAQGQFCFIEGFRTNLLIETSFHRPAYKNLSSFCLWQYCSIGRATSGVKLTLGCWSGSLTITYQKHPSPLICLMHTSSFFWPQQECLFVEPSWSAQAAGSLLPSCPLCTTDSPLFLHTLHCMCIICFYHGLLCFFVNLIEERDWISSFFVSLVPRSVTSTKYGDNSINIFEGMTIKIDELFVMAWEMHSQVLENLFTNYLLEHNIFWSWGLLALCCMLSGLCPGWAWVSSIFLVNYSEGRVMWDMPWAGIGTKWGRSKWNRNKVRIQTCCRCSKGV